MVDEAVPSPDLRRTHDAWQRFAQTFALSVLVAIARALRRRAGARPLRPVRLGHDTAGPIMDLNQRFMYPQIVRSRRYDSAVIGTSTVRLLDPRQLDALFGGHFANLAMNAATPWEQTQIAGLFLRETAQPRTLIFGIDTDLVRGRCRREAADLPLLPALALRRPALARLARTAQPEERRDRRPRRRQSARPAARAHPRRRLRGVHAAGSKLRPHPRAGTHLERPAARHRAGRSAGFARRRGAGGLAHAGAGLARRSSGPAAGRHARPSSCCRRCMSLTSRCLVP